MADIPVVPVPAAHAASVSASVPAAADAVPAPRRRLFTNVAVVTSLAVQSDGAVVAALTVRHSSKAERRVERRDRKFDLMNANRQQRRAEYKQRKKQRKQQQQQRDQHGNQAPAAPSVRRGAQFREWARSRAASAPVVCLDCQWESVMVETEVQSLSKQVKFLYAANMRAPHPLRIALSSYGSGQSDEQQQVADEGSGTGGVNMESTNSLLVRAGASGASPRLCKYMSRIEGFERWLLDRSPLHYSQRFIGSRVVYLTAESPNLLTVLRSDTVYVVGAIVDHNRLPSLCHTAAAEAGCDTARLPITECMRVATGRRTVITVNQVHDCMLGWWNNTRQQLQQQREQGEHGAVGREEAWQVRWAAAFDSALPKRGGWQVRDEWSAAIAQTNQQPQQLAGPEVRDEDGDADIVTEPS